MSKIKLGISGKSDPVTADFRTEGQSFSMVLDDQVFEGTWVATGPGEGWLNCDGKILPFYMTQTQDKLSIWLDGLTYHLSLLPVGARRAGEAGGVSALQGGDVKAPMPGTILKVLVQPGDAVEPNQPLVIMESMKMEMTLSSPAVGTVQEVSCAEGQLVEMGAVLVKLALSEA